ncbi:MAG: YedE family putative selenium transporter [Ruthenibacterium sp.]
MKHKTIGMLAAGIAVGAGALLLTAAGNPANMGFCIACFVRDMAGALGLHRAEAVQYMRPEIIGLVLGALGMALASKEFSPRGGSAPVTRFALGFCVMVGALMFLGCPLRMVLRIGGGDWNALVGLAGFALGIGVGVLCLRGGFTLKRTYRLSRGEGFVLPVILALFFALLVGAPSVLLFSEKGPGAQRAAVWLALAVGLAVGALAQRTRLCMVGGIRDAILFQDFHLLLGFAAILGTVLVGNLLLSNFHPGFAGQPIAHTDALWNMLGMVLVGWASVLLGGCPLRQLILAGEGNTDAAVTIFGLFAGAAFCHNFKLASSADGPTPNGKIAVVLCLVAVAAMAACNMQWRKNKQPAAEPPAA